jgi:hypothetical protein
MSDLLRDRLLDEDRRGLAALERYHRFAKAIWWSLAVIGVLLGIRVAQCFADDRPRAPIPRAPLISEPSAPSKPSSKPEQSDLHSHLCSNPRCNHEWWHDPQKGPVSHNCPKCGREQYVINRTAAPGARSTTSPAASLQQVVRAPVSQKTVYVVGSTTCYPCRLFKQKHGDGTAELKYVYCYMDKTRPADSEIDVATWNELVRLNNSGRFVYPFFVVKMADGEFVGAQAKVE